MSDPQSADDGNVVSATNKIVDYQPFVEALNDWQATFELALDEAAAHLDPEQFPVEDLQAYLSEMCDLLRDVLSRNVIVQGP